jgi:hypothetical protein
MMKTPLALSVLLAAAGLLAAGAWASTGAGAGPSELEMAVDMDPSGNTDTFLSPRQSCRQASPGAEIEIDVTIANIPQAEPMIGFGFTLAYPAGAVTITGANPEMLLAALPGSMLFPAGDELLLPDSDGEFEAAAADSGPFPETSEWGSGVLERLTLSIPAQAAPGLYPLTLFGTAYITPANEAGDPAELHPGLLAIGASCPPPGPGELKGDVDCNGQVTSVDALFILHHVVGQEALLLPPGCPPVSQGGDMDCDNAVTSVDALLVLRHVARLAVNLPDGCPAIG